MTAPPPTPVDAVHASHVRLAYRAMLGREATPEEVSLQLAGMRSTADLLEILSGSPEYQGVPHTLLDPPPAPAFANIWHEGVEAMTHPAGTSAVNGDAVVGREGWLFAAGTATSNLDAHLGTLQLPRSWSSGWTDLIAERHAEAERIGITALSLVVPDRLTLVGQHYPTALEPSGPRPIERLLGEQSLPLIYPLSELLAAHEQADVLLRTGSQFTFHGNQTIFDAVASALALPTEPLAVTPTTYRTGGEFGARFSPAIIETMTAVQHDGAAELAEDNRELVARGRGHTGTRRVYRNPTATDDRTVVVFGDSDSYTSHGSNGLSWFLAQRFREVHFIWAPFAWDAAYAERAGATIVISQTAEHLVTRLPRTGIDAASIVTQAETTFDPVDPGVLFHPAT